MACNCKECCKHYDTCEIMKQFGAVADKCFWAANCKDFEHKDGADNE